MKHTFTLIVETNDTRRGAEIAVLGAFASRQPDGCSFDLIKAEPVVDGSHRTEEEISAKITISRPSGGTPEKEGYISIVVKDSTSLVEFLKLSMAPADFAHVLTGMSFLPATGTVRGLAVVGKKKESEQRRTEIPNDLSYQREKAEKWLKENKQEPGWIIDPCLRSQGSIYRENEKTFARYSVFRYV